MNSPLDKLLGSLANTGMTRFFRRLFDHYPDLLMKDQTVEEVRPDRTFRLAGKWVTNFGSDSFLGLDQHPKLRDAIEKGVRDWGTHNGSSRAFSSVEPNLRAEQKIAAWLGTESAIIFPSVSLTNTGVIPGLVSRQDVVVADQFAHNSIDDGLKQAKGRGARTAKFAHNDPPDLERVLCGLRPYRYALVAVDGVYSMSGKLPPLGAFRRVCLEHDAILYVDDAHGTGVLGTQGRGTVLDALGDYDDTLVVGSLSKALSALGGFIACSNEAREVLKLRANPLIFGGPVPPPYLEAVCAAVDILTSAEYPLLRERLDANVRQLTAGAERLGLCVLGGLVPIVSVLVGTEDATLRAGKALFDQGYYVQSVIFPAVPHGAGVLRVQVNANHDPAQIDGLLGALGEVKREMSLPEPGGEAARAFDLSAVA